MPFGRDRPLICQRSLKDPKVMSAVRKKRTGLGPHPLAPRPRRSGRPFDTVVDDNGRDYVARAVAPMSGGLASVVPGVVADVHGLVLRLFAALV